MREMALASWSIVFLAATVLNATPQKPSPDLQVPLKFLPQESLRANVVALPAAVIDRTLDIRVVDARQLQDSKVIGSGTNDDDLPFAIRATTNVDEFVGAAVAQLATAQSLKKGPTPERILELRLTRFNVSESNKAIGSTYAAEVHFAFILRGADGKTLTEGASAGAASRYGRARSGGNCAEVLSDALKDAFTKTIGDAALQQAWASGQPTASAAGASGQPGVRPAPVTVEERLKVLDDLLERGVITKEEYSTRRAEILKDL